MGADPIAMCGNCREIKSMFDLNACAYCINNYFDTNIYEYEGRVITKSNLDITPDKTNFVPQCSRDTICEELERLVSCVKKGHRLLVDPNN